MTYRWAAYSLTGTNNCGSAGTTLCANGLGVYTLPDSAGSNNAVQTTSADQPTFATNQINGLPAISNSGGSGSSAQVLVAGTGFATGTNFTMYAVVEPTNLGNYMAVFGTNLANDSQVAVEYGFEGNNQFVRANGNSAIPGSATFANSTWKTIALTYNNSTQAVQMYICSSGTCTADGSAGTILPGAFNTAITNLFGPAADFAMQGYIAEWGYLNSISLTGIGAYSQCKYGL
jgi:hypothetical protein